MITINVIKQLKELKSLITLENFKIVLKQSMLLSGVFFFINETLLLSWDSFVSDPKSRTVLVFKIILVYFGLILIFYSIPKLILRYFIHSKFRDRVINNREDFTTTSFQEKKENILAGNEMGRHFFQHFMKLGLLNSSEITTPIILTKEQKEDLFNYALKDIYSWITLILHTGITLIIVFNFYSIWFISIFSLALILSILFAIVASFIILHLESLEYIRRDLVKRSKKII
jgi:ABC-type multidrug transport system fused ATPase/permease subunit